MSSFAHAGGKRYAKKHQLGAEHMIVVAAGDYEPRSTGSYAVRVYEILTPEFPTDEFVCGLIRPRDGVVEDVLFADLDGDGGKEIVVTTRCVGTGNYLSADAFRVSKKELVLLANVEELDRDADAIAALKAQLRER